MSIGDTLNGSGRLETDDAEWRAYCHALATDDYETVKRYERKWEREAWRNMCKDRVQGTRGRKAGRTGGL